jgi:membrane fusion protein
MTAQWGARTAWRRALAEAASRDAAATRHGRRGSMSDNVTVDHQPPEVQAPVAFAEGRPDLEDRKGATPRRGDPIRLAGLSAWASTAFFMAVLTCLVVGLLVIKYARKETVTGALAPASGALTVSSVKPGSVAKVFVTEGQTVKAGETIALIRVDTQVGTGERLGDILSMSAQQSGQALSQRAAAKGQIAAQQAENLRLRRAAHRSELAALDQQAPLLARQVEMTGSTLEAGLILREKGFGSIVQLNQWEQAHIQARLQAQDLQRKRRELLENLALLDVEERKLRAEISEINAGLSDAAAQLMEKEAAVLAQRDVIVTANTDGVITALQVKPGQLISAGERLATLLPNSSELRAELWLPSRAIGFVKPGNTVQIRYDAFPYAHYGVATGVVTVVAGAPIDPKDLPLWLEAREALYPVKVKLDKQAITYDGQRWLLVPGMKLSADVILERRTLVQWLFEPLLARHSRVTGAVPRPT